MSDFLDITVPISPDMLIYPGDPPVRIVPHTSEHDGTRITVSELHLGSHTGTHVDAPAHFGLGEVTVDRLPLDALLGPAEVLDLRGLAEIGVEALAAAYTSSTRVLLKTDNSRWIRRGPLPERPAHLTRGGAEWLVAHGALLVGIDGLSVDAPDSTAAHAVLLGAGVVILETVDLSEAPPGSYDLLCLPLRIAADGAPARVVLRRLTTKAQGKSRAGRG